MGNTILAKGVNHILAKRDNSAWPKGSKLSGFSIEHDKGYDVAYVANMLKADFYKKSLVDEAHLCKHIKCYLDDIDGDPCRAFDEFFATCIGKGIPVIWSDVI